MPLLSGSRLGVYEINAMRAVDTNVLVPPRTRDDTKQVAAAEAFVPQGAWVPPLAVAEGRVLASS